MPDADREPVWTMASTSCADGGMYAWLKQRPSGAWEMVGCVCHHNPPQSALVVEDAENVNADLISQIVTEVPYEVYDGPLMAMRAYIADPHEMSPKGWADYFRGALDKRWLALEYERDLDV